MAVMGAGCTVRLFLGASFFHLSLGELNDLEVRVCVEVRARVTPADSPVAQRPPRLLSSLPPIFPSALFLPFLCRADRTCRTPALVSFSAGFCACARRRVGGKEEGDTSERALRGRVTAGLGKVGGEEGWWWQGKREKNRPPVSRKMKYRSRVAAAACGKEKRESERKHQHRRVCGNR